MSEPQTSPVTVNTHPEDTPAVPELKSDIKTLKDAFPDLDLEVIETILDSQAGNLDATFEVLLSMSDPSYKPTPQEVEGLSQLRQDEEYARRLAREGDAHYPQNNAEPTQSLFNLQEELPIIKEKVIEAGTAAKNKIMNFYNQLMAPPTEQPGSSSGALESRMGNLSLSENQRPSPTMKNSSVDLYEWDGRGQEMRNPLLTPKKDVATSTSSDQLLSDEEYARKLAREDADTADAISSVTEPPRHTERNIITTTSPVEQPKQQTESDNEVSFSKLHDPSPTKETPVDKPNVVGYNVQVDEDDLDDLFDKQDSVSNLKQLDESSEAATKN
ncbi:hypothetical protein BDF21DRAFT_406085 [Thamnidium elegans]|nr:hypothetical protein BDF21DRAFT_406085 [Thamnidium elegans]